MQKPGTYQTGLSDYADQERAAGDAALCAYGELYGRVQRKLFAEVAAGSSATSLTTTYVKRYGIPSRMFNAVRVSLVWEPQQLRQDSRRRRIARTEREVGKLVEQGRWQQVSLVEARYIPVVWITWWRFLSFRLLRVRAWV